MTKPQRVSRPKGDLKRELRDQLQLLRLACESYDNGIEAAGKHIALSLRLLPHSSNSGRSRALLDQLGLRGGRFLDSAGPLNPRNMLTEFPLVMIHATDEAARYAPLVAGGEGSTPPTPRPFATWWNDPVLKDDRGEKFCRRELVLHVADTDGGAHVDSELDEAYMRLSRENSLGWLMTRGDVTSALGGRPELAYMRQIAHEVLSTLRQLSPEFREHAVPVVPVVGPA